MEISAPMWALIPHFFAAEWKRGEPYTPSRSSKAIAGIPELAAASANSSGSEAPSRKLKAEQEWSSTYISRRFLPRTIAWNAGPYRCGRGLALLLWQEHPNGPWNATRERGRPIPHGPKEFRTTTRRWFW